MLFDTDGTHRSTPLVSLLQQYGPAAPTILRRWADERENLRLKRGIAHTTFRRQSGHQKKNKKVSKWMAHYGPWLAG